ncbi:MAG: hypothetical protein J6K51_01810 [Clostridia bacterium]|nr:hypothetical protein [Clostridia bacterium]
MSDIIDVKSLLLQRTMAEQKNKKKNVNNFAPYKDSEIVKKAGSTIQNDVNGLHGSVQEGEKNDNLPADSPIRIQSNPQLWPNRGLPYFSNTQIKPATDEVKQRAFHSANHPALPLHIVEPNGQVYFPNAKEIAPEDVPVNSPIRIGNYGKVSVPESPLAYLDEIPANGVPITDNMTEAEKKEARARNRYINYENQKTASVRKALPELENKYGKLATLPIQLGQGAKSAAYGFVEGLGADSLVSLFGGSDAAARYEKSKMADITGDENGELMTSEKVGNVIGNIGGNFASYYLGTKALKGIAPFAKIKPAFVRNLVMGQTADTLIQTPRVIGEGIRSNKKASEIALDVAKQQGSDFLWNLGSETLGAFPDAVKGTKKLIDDAYINKIQRAINEDSMRGILEDVPGREMKNLVSPKETFSTETISALRKMQTVADRAGKDFSEIAGAVYQGKTMKELKPQLQDFANWVKSVDSPGYIKRIDFDDMGKIRIERGVKDVFAMDLEDLKGVRSIPNKKSVFYFNDSELQATKKWADKLWNDLGIKSPYYRATNGDWRATSKEMVEITDVKYQPDYDIKKVPTGTFQNQDTGWKITVGSQGIGDTVSYARGKKYSICSLDKIDELIKKAVLLDTEISLKDSNNKSIYTAFMHKLYAPLRMDGKYYIAKVSVEESILIGSKDTYRKFYNLQDIDISPENSGSFILKDYATRLIPDDTKISIADFYEIVKKSDEKFYRNPKKLAERSEKIRKIVADIPSGKNSFISENLKKLSDSEIEAVIKEENLPFRNAEDARKCAAFADKMARDKSGRSLIGVDSPQAKAMREQLLSNFRGKALDWLEDNLVDNYSVVKIFDRVDSSVSTDALLQMYIQSGSQSEYIKKVKFVDMDGNEIGKSLGDIFSGIRKKDRRAFDEYLFHKYNVERWNNGVPLEMDFSLGDSMEIFTKLEELHPEFKTVSEELYAFNNYLNFEYGVRSGIISEGWFDNATKVYPSYVPTFREYGGTVDGAVDSEKAGHNISKIFRSAESRHERIYDVQKLFENKIDIMVNAARKQQLQANMVQKVLHNPGKLAYVGKILDASKEIKSAKYEATALGENLSDILKRLYSNNVDDTFTMSAYIDGKLVTIGINERLHNAFSYVTAGGNQTLKAGVQKTIDFFGKHITGNFKKVVTALNPIYAGSNFFRDIPNALISTTGSMGEMAKHYPEAFYKILRHDDTFRQFCALGGADTGLMENVGKNFLQKRHGLIHKVEWLNGFIETIPRYSEFLISLKNGDDVYTALKNSADVTVNFSRGGRLAKNIDKFFIPYFNARLQGFYHSVKVTKKAPLKAAGRASLAFTIPTVLLYVANKDNPHYQDLTERQKSYYFNIPMFGSEDLSGNPTKFFKIPKTDQFGFIFGTMLEKGLRAASGDEEAFEQFWYDLSDGFMPFNTRNFTENFYSPAKRAIWDNMIRGKNDIKDFAGRPVIDENLRDLPPEQQYDESTSEIGIWIGKSIGVSPKVIDYLIKSYTGIVGEIVLPYFQPNIENKWLQPISKRFVTDSLYSNDIPTTWYNTWKEMKTRRDRAKDAGNYFDYYRYKEYANDLWEANEAAKRTKILIDGLVEDGASKNSKAVRILRDQYLNQYKKAIEKYEKILKGE